MIKILDEIVANRTQPYVTVHEKYLKVLQGELK